MFLTDSPYTRFSHWRVFIVCFVFIVSGCSAGCAKGNSPSSSPPAPVDTTTKPTDVEMWLTTPDQFNLFKKQNQSLIWSNAAGGTNIINVDSSQLFQEMDGFGYTLTGGSADVINSMAAAPKQALLQELFGTGQDQIGISYLRLSIGASDLSASVFSYNDLPAGQTDPEINQFSLAMDTVNLIPVLKQILQINPSIKILGSPWSAPLWMKDNNNSVGGSLKPMYYGSYAKYFVKYIQAMKARGITIDAITPQNEPLHGGNNPSMVMTAAQQAEFIKSHLGPALQAANLSTKIIIYDHNADRPDYPLAILADPAAKAFVDGSAFHLYGGDISALSTVHNAHPDKNVYFTEQYTAIASDFGGDLKWHLKNILIGSTRNWSKTVLEWNLANNASFGPHTNGGCTTCKGALTISTSVTRNVAYYIIAHGSKFVRPGSRRIASNIAGNLQNVAFVTPAGRKVLIVLNDGSATETFTIKYNARTVQSTLTAGAVATYVW